jgi:hypothetical protein
VSGIPGKVSQGDPPAREGMRTYHLFQREGLLRGSGTTLRFAMNQVDVARVTFDREAPNGIAAPKQATHRATRRGPKIGQRAR